MTCNKNDRHKTSEKLLRTWQRTCTQGCTRSHWVLNATPRNPSATTPDHFNPPVHHDALEDPAFAVESERPSPDLFSVKGDDATESCACRQQIANLVTNGGSQARRALRKHRWRGPATGSGPRTRQSLGRPGSCTLLHTCDPRRLQNAPAQGRKPQRSKSPDVRQRSKWTCHTSPHHWKMSTQMTVATRRKLHPTEQNRHQKKPPLQVGKLIQKMPRHNQQHRTLTARLYRQPREMAAQTEDLDVGASTTQIRK